MTLKRKAKHLKLWLNKSKIFTKDPRPNTDTSRKPTNILLHYIRLPYPPHNNKDFVYLRVIKHLKSRDMYDEPYIIIKYVMKPISKKE
ncbi:hypothetical protein CN507_02030 [Bacillus cereus]|nr:hypothetical protein COM83_25190 [Bacillus cereus]PES73370.1 hypothetical protein CN507_02030 [Bacillus cereus]PEX41541.1 hypothetical protein CN464_28165 [Bacillus cereus]PFJ49688.1 hypothetical protein COI99_21980 [Bacillus cereus]PFJ68652.1 hypothetical protein COI95_31000 [Bacillus cereus]